MLDLANMTPEQVRELIGKTKSTSPHLVCVQVTFKQMSSSFLKVWHMIFYYLPKEIQNLVPY